MKIQSTADFKAKQWQKGAMHDLMQEILNVAHIQSDSIIIILCVALCSVGVSHLIVFEI